MDMNCHQCNGTGFIQTHNMENFIPQIGKCLERCKCNPEAPPLPADANPPRRFSNMDKNYAVCDLKNNSTTAVSEEFKNGVMACLDKMHTPLPADVEKLRDEMADNFSGFYSGNEFMNPMNAAYKHGFDACKDKLYRPILAEMTDHQDSQKLASECVILANKRITALEALAKQMADCLEIHGLRSAIWFLEGPYFEPPCKEAADEIRKVLDAYKRGVVKV